MDDTGLTPLLIDAKKEYVGQLADVLAPYVINHVVSVYLEARRQSPKAPTLAFQTALRAIPAWNSHTVQQHTAAVQTKYSFLGNLIAACFVAYVKILSSVKLHQQKPNIRLKLPTDDAFVHKVYIHTAREFYTNPSLVHADRAGKIAVVRAAVEASVRDMLPIEDILKAYLGSTVDADSVVPSEFLDDDVYGASPSPQALQSQAALSQAVPQQDMFMSQAQADYAADDFGDDDGDADEDAHVISLGPQSQQQQQPQSQQQQPQSQQQQQQQQQPQPQPQQPQSQQPQPQQPQQPQPQQQQSHQQQSQQPQSQQRVPRPLFSDADDGF